MAWRKQERVRQTESFGITPDLSSSSSCCSELDYIFVVQAGSLCSCAYTLLKRLTTPYPYQALACDGKARGMPLRSLTLFSTYSLQFSSAFPVAFLLRPQLSSFELLLSSAPCARRALPLPPCYVQERLSRSVGTPLDPTGGVGLGAQIRNGAQSIVSCDW